MDEFLERAGFVEPMGADCDYTTCGSTCGSGGIYRVVYCYGMGKLQGSWCDTEGYYC
ncbi:hypothetical protein BAG01nite_49240 [Brevibacillus agri]|uniref:Bacteriocin n=1 Tax=Brevibacillus agri TaxID=51101 RepID=A0ABQ0SY96_9BACL|nr:hypothetical protein BAG01nite_49230 [Brevibacillus agri]GED28822.1 hypothetical protein BAG01nite_49240 [Brevibacillus agri]